MVKIVCCCLLVIIASGKDSESTFTGFFSRMMPIDSTNLTCDSGATPALLYAFENDSAKAATDKIILYGLIKCPGLFNRNLFSYTSKVTLSYRECARADLQNVVIINKHKFFNVRYYLITNIEAAE